VPGSFVDFGPLTDAARLPAHGEEDDQHDQRHEANTGADDHRGQPALADAERCAVRVEAQRAVARTGGRGRAEIPGSPIPTGSPYRRVAASRIPHLPGC